MAPRKKSASSASSASTASSTTSSGSSSGSGSESDSSSSGSSSSSVSAKEPKNATKAQNQPQQRRKSQDAKTQKNSDKKLASSGDEKKHPPSAKKTPNKVQAVGGGKVPPSVMKQMQVPASGPKSVKPSAGVKAAAQQKQNNAKKMSFMKEKKKGASHFTSDTEEEHKPPDMGVAPARKPSNPNQKRRGRPPKNSQPVKAPAVPSSTTDSSSSGGSDSESESSQDSSAAEKGAVKKELNNKSGAKQKKPKAVEVKKTKQAPGKINSESETDTSQRSFSPRSPKRILHRKEIRPVIKVEPIEKRRCPLDECNSLGHLGGLYERHFTIESCPMYHNMSLGDTKTLGAERRKRDEERKKAVETLDRNRKVLTPEQKNYAQKVRDLRAKFKSPPPVAKNDVAKLDYDKEREPNLKGIVPDYDFHLFRQAQSLASENIENELKTLPASKGTKYITMGKNCMQVWYQSPYPEDVARLPKLYLCEFCLRYQKCAIGIKRHAAKCVWRHPPGDEIYRKGKLGVWQIDGKRQKQYCQHLCLLAKFFLDHKTLYYDVEPFLFYVMTVADADGCHTIGYFSKEKNSFLNYNVSCILTLPPYQRKGYGRLLIDFSYLLTRVEGKIGSPEKPLSDLGLISYRSYWKDVLLNYLCTRTGNTLSIKDISQEMAINSYDIVSTLQALGMMKYWKGKHILLKKQDVLEEYVERQERRGNFPKIDPSCLRWVPFVPPQPSSPT